MSHALIQSRPRHPRPRVAPLTVLEGLIALVLMLLSFSALAQSQDPNATLKIGEINSYKAQPAFLEPYKKGMQLAVDCLLYTSPSPRDRTRSRMPSSA